jgi:prepilin-type processing-associated H-X9-DG protein
MCRPRIALVLTLVASLSLALAAGAAAKPHARKGHAAKGHKRAAPLSVDAPRAARLPVGIPTKVTVKVANRGKKPIARVVLLASHSKAVKVTPVKAKLGLLKPRKVKSEAFTVTVTAAGKPRLEFIAKAPRQAKAHDAIALKVSGAPPREEGAKASAIIGHYFWNTYQVLTTTYMHAYYFVDDHWVYRGVPKEGLPACTGQTANGDEDGCLPYTWDETSGALNIAGVTGEYKVGSHGLKVGDESFGEAIPAEAGSKFDAGGSYINQFGLCPLSCSFVTVDLKMSANGEFARASGVSGFFGEGGSYGALPPEDHGTYSIDPRGRVTFSYADGHVVTETIAVMLDGNDNPDAEYGLLLGESVYFGPHSDI